MKERPVLIIAIISTLIVELIIMALVYNKIGSERLPFQTARLMFQLLCISFILIRKSRIALFVLAAYHIINGVFLWDSNHSTELFGKILSSYHIGIGFIIYLHDVIESKMKTK